MKRRDFLTGAAASGALVGTSGFIHAQAGARPLPLLPMTDLTNGIEARVPLRLVAATHDFGTKAQSATYGINNSYLGPVLRVKQGQTLPVDVINNIEETTTLHWHGLHIPGDVDGGPHQEIEPGHIWSPDVPIAQRASMNWFHSHMHGRTAEQTYKGLAGVILIEDDESLSADLPKTYGIDDFTLVVQDKAFDPAGKMTYGVSAAVFEDGFTGDSLVVNGTLAPVAQPVPKGLIRLRILNACNARFLTLSMAEGPVNVIASDGGFLGTLQQSESLFMSPGERYEILVDMRQIASNSLQVQFGGGDGLLGFLGGLFNGAQQTLLTLTSNAQPGFDAGLPDALALMDVTNRAEATVTRDFALEMGGSEDLAALAANWGNVCGGGVMSINGRPMKMDRIDERVRKGDTELWRITVDDQMHPFHVHGCSFRILSQDGAPAPAYAQGWKDMVHVDEGWSEILVRFDYEAPESAPYMYHCHILEHEDCGMMGQFSVT